MPSIRSLFIFALFSSLVSHAVAAQAQPEPARARQDATPTVNVKTSFQALLAQADLGALHDALHTHPGFVHGTHSSDVAAVKAVYEESPALATAILELARRNENIPRQEPTNSSVATEQTSTPQSSPSTVVTTPQEVTTTAQQSTPFVVTTEVTSSVALSSPPSSQPGTSSSAATPSSTPRVSTVIASLPSTPASSSPAMTSTFATSTAPRTSAAPVTTSTPPDTVVSSTSQAASTSSPPPVSMTTSTTPESNPTVTSGVATSLYLTTYTPPGGVPTTITRLSVLGVDAPTQGGAAVSSTPSGSGSLRNGAPANSIDVTGSVMMWAAAALTGTLGVFGML